MPGLIHTLLDKLSTLLFQERCLGCRKKEELLCRECAAKARKTRPSGQKRGREQTSLLFLERLYHWGSYHDKILQQALRRFKYHGTYGLTAPFSEMLHEMIKPFLSSAPAGVMIIPIPSSKERLRSRGYNQAELLSRALAEKSWLPHHPDTLKKIRITKTQTELGGRERIFNIQNSFGIERPESVLGKTVLLVDDISTTGATLSEAARVLKEAGAKKVIGLVVARS